MKEAGKKQNDMKPLCHFRWARGVVAGALFLAAGCGVAGETNAAAGRFRLERGFKIEEVAPNGFVASPAAMAFDEDGRLFVAEMRDYPVGTPQRTGQIRLLEDSQGEGVISASTIFATNVAMPSAVVCYGGGVFVASAPNIIYFQDTDRNGVADVRRVVFSGFGTSNSVSRSVLPHSFYWGLDNRIYGANGGKGKTIKGNDSEIALNGRDFSFDPRTLMMTAEAGSGASGQTRDDWGRRFLFSGTHPFQMEIIEERYLERNPFFAPRRTVVDIGAPAVVVYRAALAEEIQAAKGKRTNEYTATWLANARGAVVYRSTVFPSNYYGNLFVADPEARVIHRAVLRDAGYGVRAERARENAGTEFAVSTDPSFRPTQILTGPDGALYVADMADGEDTGRIWRIAPAAFKPAKSERLSRAGARDLVGMLVHTNGYHRDTASRLLYERKDDQTAVLLGSMATRARAPLARVNALHALAGAGRLTEIHVGQAMGDSDWRVRAHGVWLAEGFSREGEISAALWARIRMLGRDPVFQVRLQAALSSGTVARPDRAVLLRDILARDPGNEWMETAVLSSAHDGGAGLLRLVAEEPRMADLVKAVFLGRLAEMIGVAGRMNEVQGVIDYLAEERLTQLLALRIVAGLGEGLQRTRSSMRLVDTQGRLKTLFALALEAASKWDFGEGLRLEGIRVLGSGPYEMRDGGAVTLNLLAGAEPEPIQSAGLRALMGYGNSPDQAPAMLERWRWILPGLRGEAVGTLMRRADQAPVVLTLVEEGRIPAGDVAGWQRNLLRHWPEPAVVQRANRVFGPPEGKRPGVMERTRPLVRSTGNPQRGERIFAARCAACHTIGTGLGLVGPDLGHVKVQGREEILSAILEPSARIAPGFETVVVRTLSGEIVPGTLARENASTVMVREPDGEIRVWPRLNVERVEMQEWSFMPEGFERDLSAQDLADLVQFLVVR